MYSRADLSRTKLVVALSLTAVATSAGARQLGAGDEILAFHPCRLRRETKAEPSGATYRSKPALAGAMAQRGPAAARPRERNREVE